MQSCYTILMIMELWAVSIASGDQYVLFQVQRGRETGHHHALPWFCRLSELFHSGIALQPWTALSSRAPEQRGSRCTRYLLRCGRSVAELAGTSPVAPGPRDLEVDDHEGGHDTELRIVLLVTPRHDQRRLISGLVPMERDGSSSQERRRILERSASSGVEPFVPANAGSISRRNRPPGLI